MLWRDGKPCGKCNGNMTMMFSLCINYEERYSLSINSRTFICKLKNLKHFR